MRAFSLYLDPFVDDHYRGDPWSPEGPYGKAQHFQGNTINDWGCGPGGPLHCTVGTTPQQHYIVGAPQPSFRLLNAVPWTMY
mmetsp:Transcript_50455/g.132488  ORF Transcript_50455/g.132488 Transcript_50455/m.132488 type:complete len:82 (+) Transcript_50455:39-284(+)